MRDVQPEVFAVSDSYRVTFSEFQALDVSTLEAGYLRTNIAPCFAGDINNRENWHEVHPRKLACSRVKYHERSWPGLLEISAH